MAKPSLNRFGSRAHSSHEDRLTEALALALLLDEDFCRNLPPLWGDAAISGGAADLLQAVQRGRRDAEGP